MPGSRPVPTARFQSTLSSRSRSWVSSFPGVRTVKAEVARRAPGELRQPPPHTHTSGLSLRSSHPPRHSAYRGHHPSPGLASWLESSAAPTGARAGPSGDGRTLAGVGAGPYVCPPVLEEADWALETESSPVTLSLWTSGKAFCPRGLSFLTFTESGRLRGPLSDGGALVGQGGKEGGPLRPPPPPRSQASPPVLVPGLDLRVGEVERSGELHAVLHAQVLLPLEAALQLRQLMVSEGRARLAGLLQAHWRAVPGAGDLAVALLLHCGDTAVCQGPASAPACRRPPAPFV